MTVKNIWAKIRTHALQFWKASNKERLFISIAICAPLIIGCIILTQSSPYKTPPDTVSSFLVDGEKADYSSDDTYVRAELMNLQKPSQGKYGTQVIRAKLLDGSEKGMTVTAKRYIANTGDPAYINIPAGSTILLYNSDQRNPEYSYIDRYRIPGGFAIIFILLVLVIIIGRWRGITAIAGLVVSVAVIIGFIIPRITSGHDAFLACVQGAFMIATTSIFVAHGFSKRTAIAFLGAMATLVTTIGLTLFSGRLTALSGYASDESASLTYQGIEITLASLLFGGIIIASLGVLNDITIGQAASVDEIYKAHKKQSSMELYKRGMSVGREHIAALVNTLALAYAGVALPSIIGIALYSNAPLLVILNSELVMEEIVRTAVASISILLAVPLTTALAAYILPRWYKRSAH